MHNYDNAIQKAKQLAGTPDGQKLIAMLQQMDSASLNHAMEKAAAGDLSSVQQALSKLIEDPEAKKLLENLGW